MVGNPPKLPAGKKIREMGYTVYSTRYRTPDERYRLANGEFHLTLDLKSRQWLGFGLGIGSKLLDKLQLSLVGQSAVRYCRKLYRDVGSNLRQIKK